MPKIEISQPIFSRLNKLAKQQGLTVEQFAKQTLLNRCNLQETINNKLD